MVVVVAQVVPGPEDEGVRKDWNRGRSEDVRSWWRAPAAPKA